VFAACGVADQVRPITKRRAQLILESAAQLIRESAARLIREAAARLIREATAQLRAVFKLVTRPLTSRDREGAGNTDSLTLAAR
jgi:hypothetical protein